MNIGFKRAYIQPLTIAGTADGEVIVVEGKKNEGATIEANISGLSSDPVKVYGSDVAYYVSQKGTGNVEIAFSILDLPVAAEARILGLATDSTFGSYLVGEDTEPPYCAVVLESSNAQGETGQFNISVDLRT